MAHDIFGERFIARREPAWHGLGEVFTAPIGAGEAVAAIGADFEVIKADLFFSDDVGDEYWPIPDVNALLRSPVEGDDEWRYFGTVGNNYGIIQNTRLGELMDPLTERWPVETAGLLGKGETLFLVLDAGMQDIEGDPVRQCFVIADTKDGKSALRASFTPVRVVCQNTLVAGEDSAVALRNFNHHKNVAQELGWQLQLLEQFQGVQDTINADFRLMANAVLRDTVVREVIDEAFPLMKKPAKVELYETLSDEQKALVPEMMSDAIDVTKYWNRMNARIGDRREAAYELAVNTAVSREVTSVTAWDVYNGIVEVEDYRPGKSDESASRSALFGTRARTKARGFKAALVAAGS